MLEAGEDALTPAQLAKELTPELVQLRRYVGAPTGDAAASAETTA